MASAEEALRSTNSKANFQRLTRLLMRGGVVLLRETFDSIHPPGNLPTILGNATVKTLLTNAKLTRPEWNYLYPSPGLCGKSTDFDITLTFRLLRTICNLTPPFTGWDGLPNSTDHNLEADLARVKYYRNEVYGHSKTMEVSEAEFVDLWKEISEALLRIATGISHDKRDEWKEAIDKLLHDPLTPDGERCVEELSQWYCYDVDVKDAMQQLKQSNEEIQKELRRLREDMRQWKQPVDHGGPAEMPLEDGANEHRLRMESLIESLNKKVEEKRKEISKLDQSSFDVQVQVADVKSKVQTTVDQMMAIIEARKEDIFSAVDNQAKESLDSFALRKGEVENQLKIIESTIEETRQLLSRSSSAEILGFNETFDTILQEQGARGKSDVERIPRFSFTENTKLANMLNTEGVGSVKTVFNKILAQKTGAEGKENSKAVTGFEGKLVRGSSFEVPIQTRRFRPVLCFGEYGWSDGNLYGPRGLAVNNQNEIAVTELNNHRVSVFSSDGSHLRSFGRKGRNQGGLNYPTRITFDNNGNIIVAYCVNNRVQVFSGNGEFLTKFGEKGNLDHQLQNPQGLSVTSNGDIIVADEDNKLIKIFSPRGQFKRKFGGQGSLSRPYHCIQKEQYFLVSDRSEHCINVFDLEGNFVFKFGKKGNKESEFNGPGFLSVNRDGHLMVCDIWNHRVQVFELSGKFVTKFGTEGSGKGELNYPLSTANLSDGRIVVSEYGNNRIQIFELV